MKTENYVKPMYWPYGAENVLPASAANVNADLLEALEALTEWAQTVPTDLAEDRLQANARAAIARAKGQQ